MVRQPKVLAQSAHFATARSALGEGTLALVRPLEHATVDAFANVNGAPPQFDGQPRTPIDRSTLQAGAKHFSKICSPCHDPLGNGRGIVVERGFPAPLSLASDQTQKRTDAELYAIIKDGLGNMPSLAEQLSPPERLQVVAWLRVLQRSKNATIKDVPIALRTTILPQRQTP